MKTTTPVSGYAVSGYACDDDDQDLVWVKTDDHPSLSGVVLNEEQEDAVGMAVWCAAKPHRIGILAGPAGTGKTTTIKAICDRIGQVSIICPTGRAAGRARQASGRPASTIHSFLYTIKTDKNGNMIFQRRSFYDRPQSGVIIVDEASMLGLDVMNDLWPLMGEIGISFLFVGDAFQLPPVSKGDEPEFSVFNDVFADLCRDNGVDMQRVDLKNVLRQALESPILRAATAMRENPTNWRHVLDVAEWSDFPKPTNTAHRIAGMVEDKIDYACITYTNATRHKMNRDVRSVLGWGEDDELQPGEPLLIRRNQKTLGLHNGEVIRFTGYIDPSKYVRDLPPQFAMTKISDKVCLVSPDGIMNDQHPPFDQRKGMQWPFVEANLGYAMTCHASQGSEFDWVIIQWDSAITRMPLPYRTRWLYTAFSRARTKLMIGGL